MKRSSLLFCLLVACQVNVPNPPAGTQGNTGATNTPAAATTTKEDEKAAAAAAVAEACSDTCSAYVKTCKTDCKALPVGATRTACTKACGEATEGCNTACVDSDDPETFDPESEEFDGKPEPLPTDSDTCGGIDQLACAQDSGFAACQNGNLEVEGADANGDPATYCRKSCAKNILETQDGKDDCDGTHVCFPTDFENPAAPTACTPSECDPATAKTDGFSVSPGCSYPFARCGAWAKTTFGFCNFNCTPHDETNACPIWKGYAVGTWLTGWHIADFGHGANYYGKNLADALATIDETATERAEVA